MNVQLFHDIYFRSKVMKPAIILLMFNVSSTKAPAAYSEQRQINFLLEKKQVDFEHCDVVSIL